MDILPCILMKYQIKHSFQWLNLHCGDWYMVTFHLVYFKCIGQVVKNMPKKFGIVKNLVFDWFFFKYACCSDACMIFCRDLKNLWNDMRRKPCCSCVLLLTWNNYFIVRHCQYPMSLSYTLLSQDVIQDVNKHVIVINNVIHSNETMLYYCSTFTCVWNMSTWQCYLHRFHFRT